jgi:hypothetical protein
MEAAMAGLNPAKLTGTKDAVDGCKRPLSVEPSDREDQSKQRKRRRSVSKENQTKKKRRSEGSPQVIELSSSSESSPVPVLAKRPFLGPRHASNRVHAQPEVPPLFLPSSPPFFANTTVGGFRTDEELEGQAGLPFCVEKDDGGDEMDFQLDMSLFEEEEPHIRANSSRAMHAKREHQPPSTLVPSASYCPNTTFVDSRREKQKDLAQSRMETTKNEEKEITFDELEEDDETTFDNFFSGVEIV